MLYGRSSSDSFRPLTPWRKRSDRRVARQLEKRKERCVDDRRKSFDARPEPDRSKFKARPEPAFRGILRFPVNFFVPPKGGAGNGLKRSYPTKSWATDASSPLPLRCGENVPPERQNIPQPRCQPPKRYSPTALRGREGRKRLDLAL